MYIILYSNQQSNTRIKTVTVRDEKALVDFVRLVRQLRQMAIAA